MLKKPPFVVSAIFVLMLSLVTISRADQPLSPTCTVYVNLLTEPVLVEDVSKALPEFPDFLSLDRAQQRGVIARKLQGMNMSDEQCIHHIKGELLLAAAENSQSLFPEICQKFQHEFQERMASELLSRSKAAQLTQEKAVELYFLKAKSEEKLLEYCEYAMGILNNENIGEVDFEVAGKKYPLAETCDILFQNFENQTFETSSGFGMSMLRQW